MKKWKLSIGVYKEVEVFATLIKIGKMKFLIFQFQLFIFF